jgi:FO synthase
MSGANDFGGTLMEESISKAAGSEHGDHVEPETIERLIREIGRVPYERTTTYGRREKKTLAPAQPAKGSQPLPLDLALAPSRPGQGLAIPSGY